MKPPDTQAVVNDGFLGSNIREVDMVGGAKQVQSSVAVGNDKCRGFDPKVVT